MGCICSQDQEVDKQSEKDRTPEIKGLVLGSAINQKSYTAKDDWAATQRSVVARFRLDRAKAAEAADADSKTAKTATALQRCDWTQIASEGRSWRELLRINWAGEPAGTSHSSARFTLERDGRVSGVFRRRSADRGDQLVRAAAAAPDAVWPDRAVFKLLESALNLEIELFVLWRRRFALTHLAQAAAAAANENDATRQFDVLLVVGPSDDNAWLLASDEADLSPNQIDAVVKHVLSLLLLPGAAMGYRLHQGVICTQKNPN